MRYNFYSVTFLGDTLYSDPFLTERLSYVISFIFLWEKGPGSQKQILAHAKLSITVGPCYANHALFWGNQWFFQRWLSLFFPPSQLRSYSTTCRPIFMQFTVYGQPPSCSYWPKNLNWLAGIMVMTSVIRHMWTHKL